MRPRCSLLLTLLVMLGMVFSGGLVDATFGAGATRAPAAESAVHPADRETPVLPGKRARRTRERRDDRRHEREQRRQHDRQQQDRQQDRRKRGRAARESFCAGPEHMPLKRVDGCTHGPDPAPPGFDVAQPVPPLTNAATVGSAAIACESDGQSGYRVQILYVRGSDVTSRFARYRASFQQWATGADTIFRTSAAATGGERSLRFVHDPATCQPIVTEVVVSPAGDGSFSTMIAELKARGYNRTDRVYLTFVDTTAAGICGIGTIWGDDRANGSINLNNAGPSYARVDAGCWSGSVAAHELMHNLGGVQLSAPNSSGGFHCIDEYDVMCYRDSSSAPAVRRDCPVAANDTSLFDCGHQDYYHTDPPAGSYLARYWNPANSRFLIGAPPPPSPPAAQPAPPDRHKKKPGKNGKQRKGGKHHGKKRR